MKGLLVIALALAFAFPVSAQPSKLRKYTVVEGDTLELIAAEVYGSRRHAIYIMKANGMTHPRPLKPKEVLGIPLSRTITARRGDSFEGLAAEHLDDKRRANFLARHNGLDPADGLATGQTLSIPFHVVHVAEQDLNLEDISLSYFGHRDNTEIIRDYNFFKSTKVPKGTTIVIPIIDVKSRETATDHESAELAAKRRAEQTMASERLQNAGPMWRRGRYREVIEQLTGIDVDFLDAQQAVAVGVLLGGAYVATGDTASAKAKFSKALERRKDYRLKTFDYSPKIRAVWIEAGGEIEEGE